jgi:hypothetical protein
MCGILSLKTSILISQPHRLSFPSGNGLAFGLLPYIPGLKARNFYYDRRGTLEHEDAFTIEHIHNQLLDVVSLLETFLNY